MAPISHNRIWRCTSRLLSQHRTISPGIGFDLHTRHGAIRRCQDPLDIATQAFLMEAAPDHQVVTVDGEQFAVDYDVAQPGAYHFTWLTGPDPQYGFTSRVSTHVRRPQQELLDSIRGFLAEVDPATGYLRD